MINILSDLHVNSAMKLWDLTMWTSSLMFPFVLITKSEAHMLPMKFDVRWCHIALLGCDSVSLFNQLSLARAGFGPASASFPLSLSMWSSILPFFMPQLPCTVWQFLRWNLSFCFTDDFLTSASYDTTIKVGSNKLTLILIINLSPNIAKVAVNRGNTLSCYN